ncbi:hypothetical protein QN411_16190, partial [Pseudomonas sp. CCI1.1]|uniref:hypothetical protein n=1 Tax=Pseudomonas sp. CCI1.1 TaxID=3048613 RepID=UPI002B23E662
FSIKSVFFEPQTARPLKTAAYFRPSLGIHPITLLAKSYLLEGEDISALLKRVELELNALASS